MRLTTRQQLTLLAHNCCCWMLTCDVGLALSATRMRSTLSMNKIDLTAVR